MRQFLLLPILLFVGGCATSSAGLYRMGVEHVITGTKPAQDFATCAAEVMQGNPTLRGNGGHWWVLRENGYGVPIVRWDFTDKPSGGSTAELRATAIAGAAKDKVQRCAN